MTMNGRARRLHDRQRVIANRMRFVAQCWSVYQPGITYGDVKRGERMEHAAWFTPGRFAKIHPARVCSCECCQQHYERPTKNQVRRLIEEQL